MKTSSPRSRGARSSPNKGAALTEVDSEALGKPEAQEADCEASGKPEAQEADSEASGKPEAQEADSEASGKPEAQEADSEASGKPEAQETDREASEKPEAQEADSEASEKPVVQVTLTQRESEGPGASLLALTCLVGVSVLGWLAFSDSANTDADGSPPTEVVASPVPVRVPVPVPVPVKAETFASPLAGFSLVVPKGYNVTTREVGAQLLAVCGAGNKSLHVKMAPIYPWLSARTIEKNNQKDNTWHSGSVELPKHGLRIVLPPKTRWTLVASLNTLCVIAGDRLLFISSADLLGRGEIAGIANGLQLLETSYHDAYAEEHGVASELAQGKPTVELRAEIDATRATLDKKKLPGSVSRGLEAHEENMLSHAGTLMLHDYLKAEFKRQNKRAMVPGTEATKKPPAGHSDHDGHKH